MTEKSTILIVDDSPDNLIVLNELLKDTYNVKVANGGAGKKRCKSPRHYRCRT